MMTAPNSLSAFSNLADQAAKSSLSIPHSSVPDEIMFHHATRVDVHQSPAPNMQHVSEENRLWRIYNKLFQQTGQHYFLKGKWHTYMLTTDIWQEASFSILHQKRGKESLKKFIIQIFGRTLPTNHRLNITHPKLYPLHHCQLCQAVDESIEHVLFQCSHLSASRFEIRQEIIAQISGLLEAIKAPSLRAGCMLPKLDVVADKTASLIFPEYGNDLEAYRKLSACQIPKLFRSWLETFISDPKCILKIGCNIHEHLASAYQKLWKLRCSKMTNGGVDFQCRFSTFARRVPLHELNDDDYATNSNISKVAEKNPIKKDAKHRRKRKISRAQIQFDKVNTAPIKKAKVSPLSGNIVPKAYKQLFLKRKRLSAQPSQRTKVKTTCDIANINRKSVVQITQPGLSQQMFKPLNAVFTQPFGRIKIAKDGNCLFRSIIAAQGQQDTGTAHMALRQTCVDRIASNWDQYALYANFCHKPDVPDAPDAPLANPVDPLSLFPTPDHYRSYMNQTGNWGTQLEINVLANILRKPLLVWKLETRKAMDIINYNPISNDSANAIHIIHCNGNHYEALSHRGGEVINEILTHELARQQAQGRTLIVIQDRDPPSDAPANDGPTHSSLHIRKRRMRFNNFPQSRKRRFDVGASLTSFRVFPSKLRVHPQSQQEPIDSPRMSITQKDRDILKRLAPDGCNTLTRRPQKRRKKSG